MRAILLVLCWSLPATAQIAIAEQPDPAVWYKDTMARRKAGILDEKSLLSRKPEPIPAALKDDLIKLDWLLLGAYSYPEKQLGIAYREEQPCQLDVARHLPDGGNLSFQYVASCADREHGKLYHLNFTMPPQVKTRVRDVKGETYLEVEAYGEIELHRIVSYRDGVLIVDISYDGKPRSKKVKFREVRIAMPRGFAWK
jgi:hypothetical protein